MPLLTASQEDGLPDADFAAVYTIVSKKNGRTSRTTVRKLPIQDAAHVRNALARFSQTELPEHVKARALAKIKMAAKHFGIEVTGGPKPPDSAAYSTHTKPTTPKPPIPTQVAKPPKPPAAGARKYGAGID